MAIRVPGEREDEDEKVVTIYDRKAARKRLFNEDAPVAPVVEEAPAPTPAPEPEAAPQLYDREAGRSRVLGESRTDPVIENSLTKAADRDADAVGRAMNTADEYKLDQGFVERNQHMLDAKETAQRADVARHPETAKYLEHPDNAAVSQDDIESMKSVEGAMQGLGDPLLMGGAELGPDRAEVARQQEIWETDIPEWTQRGYNLDRGYTGLMAGLNAREAGSVMGIVNVIDEARTATQGMTPEDRNNWLAGKTNLQNSMVYQNYVIPLLAADDEVDPEAKRKIVNNLMGMYTEAMADYFERHNHLADIPMSPVQQAVGEAKGFMEALSMIGVDPIDYVMGTATESVPYAVPTLVVGLATGGAGGGLGLASAVAGGTSFSLEALAGITEALESMEVDTSDPAAMEAAFRNPQLMEEASKRNVSHAAVVGIFDALGVAVGGTRLVPWAAVAKDAVKKPLSTATARLTGEALGQHVAQGSIDMAGEFFGRKAGDLPDSPAEVLAEAAGGTGTAVTEVAVGRTARAASKTASKQKRRIDTTRKQEAWRQLSDAAGESKTRTRTTKRWQKWIENVRKRYGAVEKVFVDTDKIDDILNQEEVDTAALEEAIPDLRARSAEAKTLGHQVEITTEEWATHIVGSEMEVLLQEEVRFSPNEQNARERREYFESDDYKQLQKDADELAQVTNADVDVRVRIRDDILSKLVQGGMAVEGALQNASLKAALYGQAAKKAGMNAWELYISSMPSIERQLPGNVSEAISSVDTTDVLLNKLRSRKTGIETTQGDLGFGPSLNTFLRGLKGIKDVGGELAAMDADNSLRRKADSETGMSLDDAALAAYEAGYLSKEGERPTPDQLLEAIRAEIAGEPIYANQEALETEVAAQELIVDDLEQILASVGLDIEKASNREIKTALDALDNITTSEDALFQSYDALDDVQQKVVNSHLKNRPDGRLLKERMEKFQGTPWERNVVEAILLREAVRAYLRGETPNFDSKLNANANANKTLRKFLERGEEGMFAWLESGKIIANSSKPELALMSSYTNCNPSKACAGFCYATNGNQWAPVLAKAEITDEAVLRDPVRTAEIASRTYKGHPSYRAGRVLRINERGDSLDHWQPFFTEMKAQGVRIQVFSKHPHIIRDLDPFHLGVLSGDSSNMEIFEGNDDLPVSFVWSGEKDNANLESLRAQMGKHGGVILPIVYRGGKILTEDQLAPMPQWAVPHTCPVDAGVRELPKSGETRMPFHWSCAKCNRGELGVGCFRGKVSRAIVEAETNPATEADVIGLIKDLRGKLEELSDESRQNVSQIMASLLHEVSESTEQEGAVGSDQQSDQAGQAGAALSQIDWFVVEKGVASIGEAAEIISVMHGPEAGREQTFNIGGKQVSAVDLREEWTNYLVQHPGTLFQSEVLLQAETLEIPTAHDPDPLGFYSRMGEVLDEKLPGKGTGASYLQTIQQMAKTGKFKKSELDAYELTEWLEAHAKDKLTKAEVLEFVETGGVHVQEVTLGGAAFSSEDAAAAERAHADEDAKRFQFRVDMIDQLEARGATREKAINAADAVNGADSDDVTSFIAAVEYLSGVTFSSPEEVILLEDYALSTEITAELNEDLEGFETEEPAYPSETLPGGANYTEVLLTLPVRVEEIDSAENIHSILQEKKEYTLKDGRVLRLEDTGYGPEIGIYSRNVGGHVTSIFNTAEDILEILPEAVRREVADFTGGHFEQPNILVHVRFNERTGPNGERIMFLEEIQSDWAQEGRDKGFDVGLEANDARRLAEIKEETREMLDSGNVDSDRWEANAQEAAQIEARRAGTVVPGPFVQNTDQWTSLALKRMLRLAAERGFDQVAWTPGEVQIDRYETALRQNVDAMEWGQGGVDKFVSIKKDDGEVLRLNIEADGTVVAASKNQSELLGKPLGDVIGKDNAAAILDQPAGVLDGDDLTVGGEGMKGFYDNIVPKNMNKIVKKLDKSVKVGVTQIGTTEAGRGLTIEESATEVVALDAEGFIATRALIDDFGTVEAARANIAAFVETANKEQRGDAQDIWTVDLTDKMRDNIMAGQELFQGETTAKQTIKRGAYDPARNAITLFKDADLSSFLHESSHFAFHLYARLASMPNATDEIKAEYESMLKFVGKESLEQMTRADHEKFARTFEAYLMEGRSPNLDLALSFKRVASWLLEIYKGLAGLEKKAGFKIDVDEDVRNMFDRMLATEEEIEAYDAAGRFAVMREIDDLMTEQERTAYSKNAKAADAAAQAKVIRAAMGLERKKQKAWWKGEKAEAKAEATAAVDSEPIYRLLSFLRTGEINGQKASEELAGRRLSRQAIIEMHGIEGLKLLPKMVPPLYAKEGGIHPDMIAGLFGFNSGDEMIQSLWNLKPRKEAIQEMTDALLQAKHGDPALDGSLGKEVVEAYHGDEMARAMEDELSVLTRHAGGVKATPLSVVKDAAQRIIHEKAVREGIQPGRYLQAEQSARRQSAKAMSEKNYQLAAEWKRKELLNHELFRAATDAQKNLTKMVKYFKRMTNGKARKNLPKSSLEQIDKLLIAYEFRASYRKVKDARSFRQWFDDQVHDGFNPLIDQDVVARMEDVASHIHYREASYNELLALNDMVKQAEHLGRLKNKLLLAQDKRTFERKIADLTESIYGNNKKMTGPTGHTTSIGDVAMKGLRGAHAWLTRMEFLFRRMDGGKSLGPVWTTLFKPFVEAEFQEAERMAVVSKRMKEIFSVYSRVELARMEGMTAEKIYIPEAVTEVDGKQTHDGNFTKGAILAMALNWGNDGNRQRLMDGYGWSEATVNSVLDRLDLRDWEAVQNIWDLMDSLWPDMAALEERVYGSAPERVQPREVQTKFGGFKGGYYPAAYDSERNVSVRRREANRLADGNISDTFSRAMTDRSHMKARAETVSLPIRLSLNVATQHLTHAIHDLTHREAIIDSARVISNPDFANAVKDTMGNEMLDQLNMWLQSIANERTDPISIFEKVMLRMRTGATVVALGLKVTTAIRQFFSYFGTLHDVGVGNGIRALLKFYRDPKVFSPFHMSEMQEFAKSKSKLIKHRSRTFERDVADIMKKTSLRGQAHNVQAFFFVLAGMMDAAAVYPTWIGAYEKGMLDFDGNDEKAVDYADHVVRTTQPAGSVKDLAKIQRGGPALKMVTMFYSYFSVFYNQYWGDQIIDKTKRRGLLANAPYMAASTLMLVVIPAILSDLAVGRGPDEDDKRKDGEFDAWISWATRTALSYPFNGVPVVRDGVRVVSDIASGNRGDYSFSPALDGFESTFRVVGEAVNQATDEQEEWTEQDTKHLVDTVGYWGQLPTRQAWITTEAFLAWLDDEDIQLQDFAFPRPPSRRRRR